MVGGQKIFCILEHLEYSVLLYSSGIGIHGTRDKKVSCKQYPTTLQQCIEAAENYRSDHITFNGVLWRATNGWCGFVENDKGHRTDGWEEYRHFRV